MQLGDEIMMKMRGNEWNLLEIRILKANNRNEKDVKIERLFF
jgi:hypothetical protein